MNVKRLGCLIFAAIIALGLIDVCNLTLGR